MYHSVMTKSYFSAREFFDKLYERAATFGKVSMLAIQNETGISRYLLTKLKRGEGERVTNTQIDSLYAYSQSLGLKIPHDKIVRVVLVESA
jgi:hypothetical protein